MQQFTQLSLAAAVTVGIVSATPPVLHAQGWGTRGSLPTSTSVTASDGKWKRKVTVTVLGGYAASGAQLYWFPDPFDPVSGQFAPNRKVAIGPSSLRSGGGPWRAESNTTVLGTFAAGQELVFGLWLPNNTWVFSGAFNSKSLGLRQLPDVRPAMLVNNPLPGRDDLEHRYYGWGLTAHGEKVDYNDFVFRTSQAVVTPEPATLSLLGLGLVGVAGGVRARRRRPKL